MKQIRQGLKKDNTILKEVRAPQVQTGFLLIYTTRAFMSLGTENGELKDSLPISGLDIRGLISYF